MRSQTAGDATLRASRRAAAHRSAPNLDDDLYMAVAALRRVREATSLDEAGMIAGTTLAALRSRRYLREIIGPRWHQEASVEVCIAARTTVALD